MLKKRIIPCLDLKEGRVVKGVNFENLIDAGDPIEVAKRYNAMGADEIVFLDINASFENRSIMTELVARASEELFIPLTIGGGIRTLQDAREVLSLGADKVSINTAAFLDKTLITRISETFGSQSVVLAIDGKKGKNGNFEVYLKGGRENTFKDVVEWAIEGEKLGAGEILLTSMDKDGTKSGFDIEMTRLVSESVGIPVIASGGAGSMEHFKDVFTTGKADAALAASLFHFKELEISQLKAYLKGENIEVRL